MNGAMDYPPAFRREYGWGTHGMIAVSRLLSGLLNRMIPGKRQAKTLLVANRRTAASLQQICSQPRIKYLVENGVDLHRWPHRHSHSIRVVPRFLFVGRLIRVKAVHILIDAFSELGEQANLVIVGDGPEAGALQRRAERVDKGSNQILFRGFLNPDEVGSEMAKARALILPSLRECGGAVLLEAMASGIPVIAINWGGPKDYIEKEWGYLLEPTDRASLVQELMARMRYLANNPSVALEMGKAARRAAETRFLGPKRLPRSKTTIC